MKKASEVLRAIAATVLLLSMLGAASQVSAQEDGGFSVGVGCSYDSTNIDSSCTFSVASPDGDPATGLLIPSNGICAYFLGSDIGTLTESGIEAQLGGGNSVTVLFDGIVNASGGGAYSVSSDSGDHLASGDGLACSQPEDTTTDNTDAQPPADEATDEATQEPTGTGTADGNGTPDDQNGDVGSGGTTDTGDSGDPIDTATPTETADPGGAGDPGDTGNTSETGDEGGDGAGGADVVVDVTISVRAFDCTSDPGATDPASYADCSPSAGVVVNAAADSNPISVPATGGDGATSFSAPDGSAVTVTEDTSTIPTGFHAVGSGSAGLTAAEGAQVTFLHFATVVAGRLQIVSGTCPTSGESGTTFRVVEPETVSAASALACETTADTSFTISGGALGGPNGIVTGSDGSWRGFLLPGTYTVTEDSSGESADVTVIANDISVVIEIDYVSHPLGVLNISRFQCDNASATDFTISFSGSAPDPGDDCEPTDGVVQIDVNGDVSASSLLEVQLGADGTEEVELEPGSYTLIDALSNVRGDFEITASSRKYAVIQDLIAGGSGVGGDGTGSGNGGNGGGNNSGGGNDGTGGTGNGGGNNGGTGGSTDDDGGSSAGGTGGDVDPGSDQNSDDDAQEVTDVSELPVTGAHSGSQNGDSGLIFLSLLSGALALAYVGKRSRDAKREV